MIDYHNFFENHTSDELANWASNLPRQIEKGLCTKRYGDLSAWLDALAKLPDIKADAVDLKHGVSASSDEALCLTTKAQLHDALEALIPWRKGPYSLFEINIDTEWRSDLKWDRLKPHISPLKGRRVLDVGCGNGYHCWRMLGEGAREVIGIDPSPRFVVQFYMLKKYLGETAPIDIFPLAMEDMPENLPVFDTCFSMGVLYHRRSPLDHLKELKNMLAPKGELILETLVIEGNLGESLVPEGRYAKMRNVWFLPSVPTLLSWLKKCGFKDARCVSVNQTSLSEQRSTSWMGFQSLEDYLDPDNLNKTIEGHPAPLRAVIIATH